MDDVIRIEALENGFEVEVADPKIVEENAKAKSMWKDPYKGYAFSTKKEVIEFIDKALDRLKPKEKDGGFASAFKEAASKS